MPPHHIKLTGRVWGVFAHRFAIETKSGKTLADLGPEIEGRISLSEGDEVTIEGEQKPSEIKISSIVTADGTRHHVVRPHGPSKHGPEGHDHDHAPADVEVALRSVRKAGYEIRGEPKRKPKHWEIRVKRGGNEYELHVELDGHIRKAKELGTI